MNTQVNRMLPAAPAWLYLQRAREAVNRAAAELPLTQFDPQARRQYALELAALMGKVELLQAFIDEQAAQCGYCTSGMVVAAVGLLRDRPAPAEQEVREALDGNLCRCGAERCR